MRKALKKVRHAFANRKLHRRCFRYCIAAHLVHIAASGAQISGIDAAIAFAAGFGTLAIHVTEESEEEKEGRVRELAREAMHASNAQMANMV